MYKRLLLCVICFLLCINLFACSRNKIIESDEYTFEESFEKLEKGIADKYELENFELVRIQIINPKGGTKQRLSISGYYQQNGKKDVWFKDFKLTENDKKTLYSLNETYGFIIYNEAEFYNLADLNGLKYLPIRTDVPGWVIEGIYNIVF